jgi:hypothetical protein
MADSPSPGDVLITTERGRHFLSIVPYPHRLSLAEYTAAFQIAAKWADANNVSIWRTTDGVATKLPRD